jgi:hypothetical protein
MFGLRLNIWAKTLKASHACRNSKFNFQIAGLSQPCLITQMSKSSGQPRSKDRKYQTCIVYWDENLSHLFDGFARFYAAAIFRQSRVPRDLDAQPYSQHGKQVNALCISGDPIKNNDSLFTLDCNLYHVFKNQNQNTEYQLAHT